MNEFLDDAFEIDLRAENDLLQAEKNILYAEEARALNTGNRIIARQCRQRIDAIIHAQHELLGPRD